MVAKISANVAKARVEPVALPQRPQRDIHRYLEGLNAIPLYPTGENNVVPITRAYLGMVEHALRVINNGGSHVLLCWPPQQVSFSALVSLLAIADVEAAKKFEYTKDGILWPSAAAPDGIRALLYPYARSTHRATRQVQIDSKYLGRTHLRHATRSSEPGDTHDALKDYHTVAGRAKTLTGLSRDGVVYPEFLHPTLDEMVPHGTCEGKCHPNGALLWRTQSRTDLKKGLARSYAADDGNKARFYLYGLRTDDRVGTMARKLQIPPDIILLDLTRSGRNRLGRNWVELAKQTCATLREVHPDASVLAITDDPWAFDAARFEIFGISGRGRKAPTTPCLSSSIFMPSSSIIGIDDEIEWHGADDFTVRGFSGDLPSVAQALRTTAQRLRDAGEKRGIDPIHQIVGKLRRSASLPGSLTEFSDYIANEVGDAFAADTMSEYRISRELSELQDPLRGIDQVGGQGLKDVLREVVALLKQIEAATPMSGLLEQELVPALRASSRSVFIFRSQIIAEFALDRFLRRMPNLSKRLEKSMTNLTGPSGLTDIIEMTETRRNEYKKVIYVAPTREGILKVMAQPWLAREVAILADVDTLRFAARDAERLAQQLGQGPVSHRLLRFSVAAKDEVTRRGCHTVALDTIVPPSEDIDFPAGSVINLAGSARGARDLVEITLDSRQRMIARPSTRLVVRDESRAIAEFNEKAAKEILIGDQVCTISAGFIEQARPLLNITATAADMIRDYHEDVIDRFEKLPGSSIEERLRSLTDKMGEPSVPTQRARYWVTLLPEMDKSLEQVVPHAPKDIETFLRFTNALGIAQRIAERFWAWAIIAQRASKSKAGYAFHEAYKGILTDPHSAAAANKSRAAEIRQLRTLAEDFVATVQSIREFRG